jgi:hypothetical protein
VNDVVNSHTLSSKLTRLAGEDAVLGGHLLVCGVQLARNGFDHVPAGGGQTPVVRHQPAGPGDEQAAAVLSQYQRAICTFAQLKASFGVYATRIGLCGVY